MRILVDTHVMLWWLGDDSRLSRRAREILRDGANELLWSIASSWEIAVKLQTGKLSLGRPIERLYGDLVSEQGLEVVPIGHEDCACVASLPRHHGDPFDRMLVAQARQRHVGILSADRKLSAYEVEVLW